MNKLEIILSIQLWMTTIAALITVIIHSKLSFLLIIIMALNYIACEIIMEKSFAEQSVENEE